MISFFVVRGHSMEPSAREGDFVFVWKLVFSPKKEDVVVFCSPISNELFLKRVAKIQQDSCWLQGDNALDSQDSRQFGWVPKEAILGKAYVIHSRNGLTR